MPKTVIKRYIPVSSPDVASVGYDPDSSTLDIEWLSTDEENGDHVLTMRRYCSVPSFTFARIMNAADNEMAATIARELRGAPGVVVQS